MGDREGEVEELERILTNKSAEPIQISYSVIKSITKNFCQPIGHGASGVVYLGALRNNVMVAVKKLCTGYDFSDTHFLKEAKCLNRVNHKNIVRFLGYCADTHGVFMKVKGEDRLVEEPKRFLCFEYAPNGTLHHYLQEKTYGYEWSIRYKLLRGICQGLQYLHQQRITHLDLKPENVLLGAQMEPKITDFGLSRCNDGTQSTIFTTNYFQGTLGYIAPELIDEGKISFKSDIYSLGIIMIRLLTGSNTDIPDNWCESLIVDCQQMATCIEIAKSSTVKDPQMRPTISEIICKLTETETMTENVPPDSIFEPTNDPNSRLCQNVKRFLSWPPESGEYNRGSKKRRVERPKWKLAFHSPPKLPIITGQKIMDTNGNPLEVILVDVDTGEPSASPNVLELELVPLLGNFPHDYWEADDFQKCVVENLEGRHPLLAGDYRLTMWDGRAPVNELMFTDDSRKCGCMFRIGVRIVPGTYHGTRILEAMTEAFMVREHREDKLYKEHYKWQLVFQSQPQLPIYVGSKIKDVIGDPLEVILVDTETGSPSALPMKLEIQLVPLLAIFNMYGGEDWSADEFQNAIVKPWKGQGPLLSGDVRLTMTDEGRVTVNELRFTCSLWSRIGVCVVSGSYKGVKILEGITKDFDVQDSRHNMNKKCFPPGLDDKVYKLKGISYGLERHRRLDQNNVRNVRDFLRMLAVKPDKLRSIMGDSMEDKTSWEAITSHARTCIFPVDKVYAYRAAHTTIYVNFIFNLVKVEVGGVALPILQLAEAQKRLVQQARWEAYEHPQCLQEVTHTWKLAFKRQPLLPINTGSRITDRTGNPLEIILVDAKTGYPSVVPMELHIQLVPLFGDFPPYDCKEGWSAEEFGMAIVKPRQQNVPLLKGHHDLSDHCSLIMMDGRVTVDLPQFTDSSSWVRCGKFRIGACVVPGGNYDGACRIVEAMSEAFLVGDLNRKHYPPILDDPVWRLEMIDKDGALHRKLTSNNVNTVQEFLRMLVVKPDDLRTIVGDGMTDQMWEMTTEHATTCVPGDKVYVYHGENGTIYMDSVFVVLLKIVVNGVECRQHQLDKAQTVLLRQLIMKAYEQRHNLQEVGATMDVRPQDGISIFWLLQGVEHEDNINDYNAHAQQLVQDDEAPLPTLLTLSTQPGPSQTENSSVS